MKNVYFAIPEIYGDSLSYYEVLRELIKAMNVIIDNYDTIPEQIADAVKNLDAAQLFSAVLNQLIDTIATDNTKSANAVKVYKKHDLLYATFNETVNLYESIIDFTSGTETELIIGTNIREVNISELFIELRKLIDDERQTREHGDTTLQNAINTETSEREQADTTLQQNINAETSAREQGDTALQNAINIETSARSQADTTLQNAINAEKSAREQANTTLQANISNEAQARSQADTALQTKIEDSYFNVELLWTNPNPTAPFGQQSINLDLRNYKGIYILSIRDTNQTTIRHYDFFTINSGGGRTFVPSSEMYFREEIEVNPAYVSIGQGFIGVNNNNTACIPYQIYGIK